MRQIRKIPIGILFVLILPFLLARSSFASGTFSSYEENENDISNSEVQEVCNPSSEKLNVVTEIVIPFSLQAFGAFGGVLGAFYLSNRESRRQNAELELSLRDELQILLDELEERIKSKDDYLMFRYSIPAWESGLTSGILSSPSCRETYKKYIEVYSHIQYAQELEKEYTQAKINESSQNVTNIGKTDSFLQRYISNIIKEKEAYAIKIDKEIKLLLKK